jgi:hypothetical protein
MTVELVRRKDVPNGCFRLQFSRFVESSSMQKSKARRRATKKRRKEGQNTTFKTERKSSKTRLR